MEKFIRFTFALIIPFLCFSQDDISTLFDDLGDLDPAPQPATKQPAASTPRPAPETPVVYKTESGGEPITPKKKKAPAVPINIEKTLALGTIAYRHQNWNEAQALCEAVLAIDPHHKKAIGFLQRIAEKKGRLESRSFGATRTRMLGNVQAAWNTPKPEGKPAGPTQAIREPTKNELRTMALCEKLESIRIPAIAFQNANIQQVVLELSALCRKLDPEQKGINLVVFGISETLLPPVTFSGTDLSALETLDIVTQISGMKYTVAPNLVSLTPVNYEPPQQMVPAEMDVIASVGNKMALMAGEQAEPAGLLDVRDFFSTVPFPPGASIRYNPDFSLLLVHNVPRYIDRIAALLKRYNQKALDERARQVEIETKFVEVSEGALEELGFEWTLGAAGKNITSDTVTMPGGQKLFSDTLRSGEDAFGASVTPAGRAASFNAYGRALSDPTSGGLVGTAGELLIRKVKGDLPVGLIIRALERQAGSDLLSAPRVLTKSGETATIHVGEAHWFPTAYDVTIERYAQPSLVPLDYDEEKTGVMLEVTPELDPDSGTIDMKLSPEIRELAGFDEQHVSTIWPDFGDEALDMDSDSVSDLIPFLSAREENRTINADRLIARRPVFKIRKVETTLTIEDGSTIVMGGLIKEKLETFKDSVPILGKIPFIGRLFRSEGERAVKRNLMIFVTASQVDASGRKRI